MIVGMANGEPIAAIDALEAEHERLDGVRIHQMHAMRSRPHIEGRCGDHLRHVSYFLSEATRRAVWEGTCDMVPADFSQVPRIVLERARDPLVLAAASPPDADGWCTLGVNAEYVAALRGKAPFVLEVNERMPTTHGDHRIRLDDVAAWYRVDRPLIEVGRRAPDARDEAIAAAIAERVPDGATLQVGIGAVPDAVCAALHGHRDLGIHTELIGEGVMGLIESGAVTGARKATVPGKAVATFTLGTQRLHDWLDGEERVAFHPVDMVNDPRVIAQEPHMVSVNATTEVDLYGQCASETIAGRPWSGSGGQADFATGAVWSTCGEAFVVLHATTSKGLSRIRGVFSPRSLTTTHKNIVDHVVTEYGMASLRGRTLEQRARALIAIAHPDHRDELERDARAAGLLGRRADPGVRRADGPAAREERAAPEGSPSGGAPAA
nr:acetyl-CoA hydrolase/transferase C-terminal domain-containing protein [Patulibacter sp. SYSU D01012]